MAGYLHRTAQPPILAVFLPWGVSAGAGRARPAAANIAKNRLPILLRIYGYKTNNVIVSSTRGSIIH